MWCAHEHDPGNIPAYRLIPLASFVCDDQGFLKYDASEAVADEDQLSWSPFIWPPESIEAFKKKPGKVLDSRGSATESDCGVVTESEYPSFRNIFRKEIFEPKSFAIC